MPSKDYNGQGSRRKAKGKKEKGLASRDPAKLKSEMETLTNPLGNNPQTEIGIVRKPRAGQAERAWSCRLSQALLSRRTVSRRRTANWAMVCSRWRAASDRKSTRLNSSHGYISYAVFCLKKKTR